MIIRYRLPPDNFDDTVKHFKKEMASQGYEEGKNIEYVDLLTSTGDQVSIPEVEKCVEQHKDSAAAFVTCGWVSMVVRSKLKETKCYPWQRFTSTISNKQFIANDCSP